MAFSDTYTEEGLAAAMVAELSDVAAVLGWTGLAHLQHAVNRTLRLYGVSDIASATDPEKLEALAFWQAWAAAVKALSARIDQDADGADLKRSQYVKHAQACLAQAAAEAAIYVAATGTGSGAAETVAAW